MNIIKTFFDERTSTLTYVVYDDATQDAVIIDPVLDYEPASSKVWTASSDVVIDFVQAQALNVHMIMETHAHADHLSGAQHLKQTLPQAQIVIGRDIQMVQKIFKSVFGLPAGFSTDGSQFDRLIAPGEIIEAGSLRVEAIPTPGHTPACMTYKIGGAIFTGDVIFMPDLGTGRCDFPGGSAQDLYHSIHDVLYALPDDTCMYVGHDYPKGREVCGMTTVGAQKRENIALPQGRSQSDFVTWRNTRDATLNAPKLLFQSVQVNIDAGKLPHPEANQTRYLKIPINAFKPDPEPSRLSIDPAT